MYGLLERERPHVSVLTDGGGHRNQPRLEKTAAVVDDAGSKRGRIFGRLPDGVVYDALLAGDLALFSGLAEELAEDWIANEIDCVVGDAAEGYNSVHDVWRMVIDAAVAYAGAKGRRIENCECYAVAPPDQSPAGVERYEVTLNDAALARKLQVVRAYHPRLAADVDAALSGDLFYGIASLSGLQIMGEAFERLHASIASLLRGVPLDALRREFFWRRDPNVRADPAPPFYERYGEELVRLGKYAQVIRYEKHLRPISDALRAAR